MSVAPGEARTIEIQLSRLANHSRATLGVRVVHGRKPGPVLFVSAAVHGDEVMGVEVIRRLIASRAVRALRGTLLLVPIVNAYGFVALSRYLPDRRDLNRSFPGHAKGSLASQLAHVFMHEVVERSDYGIDLHTGAIHRANLPQIRADLSDRTTRRLAEAFAAPVTLDASLRDGSLRESARDAGVPCLLYEAGEALRFDESAVRVGLRGVLRVMESLEMIHAPRRHPGRPTVMAGRSHWLRCPSGGLLRLSKRLGDLVSEGERVGVVSDPFGDREVALLAEHDGIVIGRLNLPVVNRGDAALHVARPGAEGEHALPSVREALEDLASHEDYAI